MKEEKFHTLGNLLDRQRWGEVLEPQREIQQQIQEDKTEFTTEMFAYQHFPAGNICLHAFHSDRKKVPSQVSQEMTELTAMKIL